MKKVAAILALAGLMAVLFSCASDIVLQPPPSFKGAYKGQYIVTELGENPVEHKEWVNWKFTDEKYNMSIDEENPNFDPNNVECFCLVYGDYEVKAKVVLKQIKAGVPHAGCNTCRDDYSPQGEFELKWVGDTLLTLTFSDGILKKELRLLPAIQ